MKKIPTLFIRDQSTKLVIDAVTPGCEWVIANEGVATQKHDGTCCLIRGGKLFKRHEVKPGGNAPAGFEPANDVDETTGKQQGWLPVGDGPEDRWHREAVQIDGVTPWPGLRDGTYELCGPKIQGNPEGLGVHMLVPHGVMGFPWFPRSFGAIKAILSSDDWIGEGVVWHHPDGRMVKVKVRDFGLKRKAKS